MKKTTKGAIAAGVGVALLLGGPGTLSFWSDTKPVPGATLNAGTFSLGTPSCSGGWVLDAGEATASAAFVPGTTKLVPGDVISKTCTVVVTAAGEHLRATISAAQGTNTGALLPALQVGVSALTIGGTTVTELTEANNGNSVSVTVTVTFTGSSGNTTQNLAAVLDDITLTATQVHT